MLSKDLKLRISRIPGAVLCAGAIVLIGLVDYITGYRVDFSIFYFIPIAFASVYWRKRTGVIISCMATAAYFLSADFVFMQPPALLYTNALLHGLAFLMVGIGGKWLRDHHESISFISRPMKRLLALMTVLAILLLLVRWGSRAGVLTDVSVFYFIPILIASILFGRKYGILTAVVSAALFFFVGIGAFSKSLVFWKNMGFYWDIVLLVHLNMGLHLLTYVVVAMIFAPRRRERIEQRPSQPVVARTLFPTLYVALSGEERADAHFEPSGRWMCFQPLKLFLQRMIHDRVLTAFMLVNTAKVAFFSHVLSTENALGDWVYFLIVSALFLSVIDAYLFASPSRIPFAVFYGVQLLYLCANTWYFSFFEYYLTIDQTLEYLWQLAPVLRSLPPLMSMKILIFMADLPLFLVLICRDFPVIELRIRFLRLKTAAAVGCLSAILFGVHAMDITHGPHARVGDPEYHNIHLVHDVSLPLFQAYDFFSHLFTDEQARRPHELEPSSHKIQLAASARKSNIVLIQVEALDSEAVGTMHRGQPVAPFLYGLRNQCVYYPYALSYHAGGGSSDGEFVILNSMEPVYLRSTYFQKGYFFPNSIVKILRKNGFETLAFHGNRGDCWNRTGAYKRMGYKKFWDLDATGLTQVVWGAPDRDLFRFTEAELSKVKQPFFAHIITMSMHYPYNLTKSYFHDPLFDDVADEMQRDYYNSLRYTDHELKKLVAFLRGIPNTFIFIYGDHPSNVQTGTFRASKLYIAGRNLEFVPLYIITPGQKTYREEKVVASFIDVAPTILAEAGVGGTYATHGQNLLEYPLKDQPIRFYNTAFSRSKLFEECLNPPSVTELEHRFPVSAH